MGLFVGVLGFFAFLWTLITSYFSTVATLASRPIILTDDAEAGALNEDAVNYEDSETLCAIPTQSTLTSVSADVSSLTTVIDTSRIPVSLSNRRYRTMISINDTMAADLWRNHVTAHFGSGQCSSPSVTRPVPLPRFSLSSDDGEDDVSELAYLSAEPTQERSDSPAPSFFTDSCCSSDSGHSTFSTTFSEESECHSSAFAHPFVGSRRSETTFVFPAPKLPHSLSRPTLTLNLSARSTELESPSPVDSGYGSRPITPIAEKDNEANADTTWSPVDDSSSLSSESASSHCQQYAYSDVKRGVVDAKTAQQPDFQGPVTPQIVLFDEEGRLVETNFDEVGDSFYLTDEDTDSPYGGFMPIVEHRTFEAVAPAPRVATHNKTRSLATGSVFDRAFVPYTRTHVVPSTTAPVHHNRHRAPTFVLDCLGEEEEEEEEEGEVPTVAAWSILEEEEGCGVVDVEVSCVKATLEALSVGVVEDKGIHSPTDSYATRIDLVLDVAPRSIVSGPTAKNVHQFIVSDPDSDEDDECEACGLCFTAPDELYSRLMETLERSEVQPTIVFGLLKTLNRTPANRELNTSYHVMERGRGSLPGVAYCTYDCERGYWAESGEQSGINFPYGCPAHGGQGACDVGAIFHQSANLPVACTDGPLVDYAVYAAELVGFPPKVQIKSDEEDLDDDDLVLHSAEKMKSAASKHIAPKGGAGYDDYMSRFMDDVDLSSSNSADATKNAPFGKLGGALKELRGASMPEAVDHLKGGLEKTESVFRAAFATHFRLNSMADKFARGHRSQLSKEKLPIVESCQNAKETSTSGMKTKWSNMLSKFTR